MTERPPALPAAPPAAPEFEAREFEIDLGAGERLTVEGLVCGPLGAFSSSTGWRLCHLASGYRIGNKDFREREPALRVLAALKGEDWSGKPGKIQKRRALSAKVTAEFFAAEGAGELVWPGVP